MVCRLSVCKTVVYAAFTEIQGCSVINGSGRAPLIVIPDTGTRPQTKQERSRVPFSITFQWKASELLWGPHRKELVAGYLVMTVEETTLNVRTHGWGRDLRKTNAVGRATEPRVVECPDMDGRDL